MNKKGMVKEKKQITIKEVPKPADASPKLVVAKKISNPQSSSNQSHQIKRVNPSRPELFPQNIQKPIKPQVQQPLVHQPLVHQPQVHQLEPSSPQPPQTGNDHHQTKTPQIQPGNGPSTVVIQNQTTVLGGSWCGTLCISIDDYFITFSPTILLIIIANGLNGYGAITLAYFPGIITCLVSIGASVCSCGELSLRKYRYLVFYKWYRLVFFVILLLLGLIIIIIYFVTSGKSSGNEIQDAGVKLLLLVLVIMGIVVFLIPGILMALTHICYVKDMAFKESVARNSFLSATHISVLNNQSNVSQVMPLTSQQVKHH